MKPAVIIVLIVLTAAVFYWVRSADTQVAESPRIVSTSPADGQNNVPTDSSIHVYFSNPMDPSTLNNDTFRVTKELGSAVEGDVTYANRAAAFVPFLHLDDFATFQVTLSGRVRDSAGRPLGSDYSWTFQTAME